jgi:hypothetical protein
VTITENLSELPISGTSFKHGISVRFKLPTTVLWFVELTVTLHPLSRMIYMDIMPSGTANSAVDTRTSVLGATVSLRNVILVA